MMKRTVNCLAKLDRMDKTMRHEEADRVPVSDEFWDGFLKRWREELGLADDTNPYTYYDLEWICAVPNMDPHIKPFEVLEETEEEIIVRTGYEAVVKKVFAYPMPGFLKFETDTLEKMKAFQFDDPWDDRRWFSGGDNQMAGIGNRFTRNLPPWIDTVKSLYADFPLYGEVCEGFETLWRIIGMETAFLWMGLYPEDVGRFVERINAYNVELTKAQIKAAGGMLDGMLIIGDVAYKDNMFFSPDYWRKYFKPGVKEIIDVCHAHGIPVIYHGCGNVKRIFEDFIEVGVDAYNPLEAKAGLDVVDLRKQYGHRIAFCGNMNVIEWANESQEILKTIVLRKLNAAKGGGYIFQSDHTVSSDISGTSYDYVINLVRKYGRYPLRLGEHDIQDVT